MFKYILLINKVQRIYNYFSHIHDIELKNACVYLLSNHMISRSKYACV